MIFVESSFKIRRIYCKENFKLCGKVSEYSLNLYVFVQILLKIYFQTKTNVSRLRINNDIKSYIIRYGQLFFLNKSDFDVLCLYKIDLRYKAG